MLYSSDMKFIQMPCSDDAFKHGRKVRTRLLGETDEMYSNRREKLNTAFTTEDITWEFGECEGELGLYIQATRLFGEVTGWICAGGRR